MDAVGLVAGPEGNGLVAMFRPGVGSVPRKAYALSLLRKEGCWYIGRKRKGKRKEDKRKRKRKGKPRVWKGKITYRRLLPRQVDHLDVVSVFGYSDVVTLLPCLLPPLLRHLFRAVLLLLQTGLLLEMSPFDPSNGNSVNVQHLEVCFVGRKVEVYHDIDVEIEMCWWW